MKKLLFNNSRIVYDYVVDKPHTSAENSTDTSSFDKQLNEQNRWQRWNTEVRFDEDPQTTIASLAQRLYEQDDFYSLQQYQEIITSSLQYHVKGEGIADDVKISTLWKYLTANGCDEFRVISGRLAVFHDGQELTISNLLKPEPMSLETGARKLYEMNRSGIYKDAFKARMAFIQAASNLPSFGIS